MKSIILIPLMSTFLAATINIVTNKLSKKKVVLDKRYAVKAILLFLLSFITLFFLEKL